MELTDFISIFSILLAIFAFVEEKERKFVLNKFNIFDYSIIAAYLIFINFLFYYKWWTNNFVFLHYFEHSIMPETKTWAYILSVIVFLWIIYKIFFASFPNSNKDKIIRFYLYLLYRKDFHTVYSYIHKYNKVELLEKNNDFTNDLINRCLSNYSFLRATVSYNYNFIIQIIKSNKYSNKLLNTNFIEAQIDVKSYVFNNIISVDEIRAFYRLLDNEMTTFNRAINRYTIKYDNERIATFIIDFCSYTIANSGKNNFSILKSAFSSTLQLNDERKVNTFLHIMYEKMFEMKCESNVFEALFESITDSILHLFNSKIDSNKYINTYIENCILLYESSNKSTIKNTLVEAFENDESNAFRVEFYNIWKNSNKGNNILYNDILQVASNY